MVCDYELLEKKFTQKWLLLEKYSLVKLTLIILVLFTNLKNHGTHSVLPSDNITVPW